MTYIIEMPFWLRKVKASVSQWVCEWLTWWLLENKQTEKHTVVFIEFLPRLKNMAEVYSIYKYKYLFDPVISADENLLNVWGYFCQAQYTSYVNGVVLFPVNPAKHQPSHPTTNLPTHPLRKVYFVAKLQPVVTMQDS